MRLTHKNVKIIAYKRKYINKCIHKININIHNIYTPNIIAHKQQPLRKYQVSMYVYKCVRCTNLKICKISMCWYLKHTIKHTHMYICMYIVKRLELRNVLTKGILIKNKSESNVNSHSTDFQKTVHRFMHSFIYSNPRLIATS